MTTRFNHWLILLCLLLGTAGAHAAINCTVSSPGFASAYDPLTAGNTVVQSSFTISCTRLATDATSVNYQIGADNGLYKLGKNTNQALLISGPPSYVAYDIYKDSGCATQWKAGGGARISGTFTFPAGALSSSLTQTYYGCIFAGQTGLPAGFYSDTVSMTLVYGGSTFSNSFGVQISTGTTCAVSSPPATLAFGAYVAYGGALGASTSFGATCTNLLPYTMAVSPTMGTIAGVVYDLTLSAASATGSGFQQNYLINGNMAAGQAGTCALGSCSGTVPHTLTLSY